MYNDILQQIGLPKNEAKIYISLLERGKSNISEISSQAKVNRRNVYDAIENLVRRRLVFRDREHRERVYLAESPKKLQSILENKKNAIQKILPELQAMYDTKKSEEQAFIARGTEGIKNFWKFASNQNEPIYFVGGKGAWHDSGIDEDRKRFAQQCKKNNVKIYGTFDYEMYESGKDIYAVYDENLIRFLPKKYSTLSSMDICADRVIMFNVPKDRVIEKSTQFTFVSQSLADSYRKWFQFVWKKSKPLSKMP